MELICTRPGCPRPQNLFMDLDDPKQIKTVTQKFCTACGMPLILAGRYLPQRLLGKGGFGAAYYAVDRFSPALKPCVVKIFQPDGNLSATQLDVAQGLFEREAEALEQLGNAHPQIPDLLAFFPLQVPSLVPGKVQELFYLVQEYIDGQSLEQELAQNGPFPETEVLGVVQTVLKILKFVHDRDTIHRDIKPSNIMRDRQGRIFLLDFGAVKQVTQSAGKPTNSSTGIYSPGYAPPEQMQGGAVYPSTDLYALAVTALELLTGQEPGVLYDSYRSTWNYRNHGTVSDAFAAVLDKMLQVSPSQRFASAAEVQTALASRSSASSSTAMQSIAQPTVQPRVQPGVAPPVPPAPSSPPSGPPAASPPSPQPPPVVAARRRPFSLLELLGHAAFTGVQGSLLGIAIASFLGTVLWGTGLWLMLLVGLVALQYFRVLEGVDLAIIAGLSLLVVGLIGPLHRIIAMWVPGGNLLVLLVFVIAGGLVSVAIVTLFQLLYRVLQRFF